MANVGEVKKYLADFNDDEEVSIIAKNEIIVIRQQAENVPTTPSVEAEAVVVEVEEPSDDNGEKVD